MFHVKQLRKKVLCLALLPLLLFSGCGIEQAGKAEEKPFYQLQTSDGQELILKQKPEKIVLLSPSFLNVMHAVGGDFCAWADAESFEAPDYAKDKPTIGFCYQLNAESLIGMNVDLVIGQQGLHSPLAKGLQAAHIPFLLLPFSSSDDVAHAAEIMGDVTGHHEKGLEISKHMKQEMHEISENTPDKGVTYAVIFGVSRGMMIVKDGSIATETADLLHMKNVFGKDDGSPDTKMVSFSMEELMARDPDVIFLTTMVVPGQELEVFKKTLLDNPTWQSLRAVQENRVYALPQNLFLLNPGIDYPKSMRYMSDLVYGKQ